MPDDPKKKRVRVTLELDNSFLSLLSANVRLGGLMDGRQMAPRDVLAVLVLGEARGMIPEQIYLSTPIEWRHHIEVVHAERRWSGDGGETWNSMTSPVKGDGG